MMEATGHPISHRKPHEHGMEEEEKYILGFWIFLASDLVLFASLFATYLVLRTHTDGGPMEAHLFEIPVFTLETFLLLTSSFTCGLATYEMRNGHLRRLIGWLAVTVLLGLAFVGIEVSEFITIRRKVPRCNEALSCPLSTRWWELTAFTCPWGSSG